MNKLDFLIVGGGLAGSILAFELYRLGFNIRLLHHSNPGQASIIDTGIINPITGKRFVKSWEFENLYPTALRYYTQLEKEFNLELIKNIDIIQFLNDAASENNWHCRIQDDEYHKWLKIHTDSSILTSKINEPFSIGTIQNALQVRVSKLINCIHHRLHTVDVLISEAYLTEHFNPSASTYKEYQIRKAIIFSEGHMVLDNPFFNWVPIMPLKGEFVHFLAKDLNLYKIISSKYTIIPLTNDEYWLGASYGINDRSLIFSESEFINQYQYLDKLLKCSWSIVLKGLGIRAASRDRKPIIGPHPTFNKLWIFNGFGTKGCSLIPYCTEMLVNHFIKGLDINYAVDIKRLSFKGFIPVP
ncbi:MAG: FAD-dependent oxidoreductase [Bacteroidota bacterium]|nr:FAD-dependent oxidoreductase [Bacteroidota bacterium]